MLDWKIDLGIPMIVSVQLGQMLQDSVIMTRGRMSSFDGDISCCALSSAGGLDGGFGGVVACVRNIGPAWRGDGGGIWEDFDVRH